MIAVVEFPDLETFGSDQNDRAEKFPDLETPILNRPH